MVVVSLLVITGGVMALVSLLVLTGFVTVVVRLAVQYLLVVSR